MLRLFSTAAARHLNIVWGCPGGPGEDTGCPRVRIGRWGPRLPVQACWLCGPGGWSARMGRGLACRLLQSGLGGECCGERPFIIFPASSPCLGTWGLSVAPSACRAEASLSCSCGAQSTAGSGSGPPQWCRSLPILESGGLSSLAAPFVLLA
ncbi:hypothetical protein NDU88_001564 [Pleurodeles waltl]|uniref:Uncharacterized protein n=1 Tax=Pleurodeles waltl TaxID=8319 RepID=A0AAV7U8A3_PLEWA|nr:hypothetical protein NDU88_001564 [Pleurodeles waltl]